MKTINFCPEEMSRYVRIIVLWSLLFYLQKVQIIILKFHSGHYHKSFYCPPLLNSKKSHDKWSCNTIIETENYLKPSFNICLFLRTIQDDVFKLLFEPIHTYFWTYLLCGRLIANLARCPQCPAVHCDNLTSHPAFRPALRDTMMMLSRADPPN